MTETASTLHIRIVDTAATTPGQPAGKLADAELHFSGGLLDGLKLIGFSIWQRRDAAYLPGQVRSAYNVTFPARTYQVNGERRSFALLRPTSDTTQQFAIRDAILQAYDRHQAGPETADQAADEPPARAPFVLAADTSTRPGPSVEYLAAQAQAQAIHQAVYADPGPMPARRRF